VSEKKKWGLLADLRKGVRKRPRLQKKPEKRTMAVGTHAGPGTYKKEKKNGESPGLDRRLSKISERERRNKRLTKKGGHPTKPGNRMSPSAKKKRIPAPILPIGRPKVPT